MPAVQTWLVKRREETLQTSLNSAQEEEEEGGGGMEGSFSWLSKSFGKKTLYFSMNVRECTVVLYTAWCFLHRKRPKFYVHSLSGGYICTKRWEKDQIIQWVYSILVQCMESMLYFKSYSAWRIQYTVKYFKQFSIHMPKSFRYSVFVQ